MKAAHQQILRAAILPHFTSAVREGGVTEVTEVTGVTEVVMPAAQEDMVKAATALEKM